MFFKPTKNCYVSGTFSLENHNEFTYLHRERSSFVGHMSLKHVILIYMREVAIRMSAVEQ